MAGNKHDGLKLDLTLVPSSSMKAIARALNYGAGKYGRNNYKQGIAYTRVIAACLRHLTAWQESENIDDESKLSHLDHAMACLAMLSYYESKPELASKFDDRDVNAENRKTSGAW